MNTGVYAFETWNGGLSAFYEDIHAVAFIHLHNEARKHAKLHVYSSEREAREAYLECVVNCLRCNLGLTDEA